MQLASARLAVPAGRGDRLCSSGDIDKLNHVEWGTHPGDLSDANSETNGGVEDSFSRLIHRNIESILGEGQERRSLVGDVQDERKRGFVFRGRGRGSNLRKGFVFEGTRVPGRNKRSELGSFLPGCCGLRRRLTLFSGFRALFSRSCGELLLARVSTPACKIGHAYRVDPVPRFRHSHDLHEAGGALKRRLQSPRVVPD